MRGTRHRPEMDRGVGFPKGSVGIVPPEDNLGWSGRHPNRSWATRNAPRCRNQAATIRRAHMFDSLTDSEKKGSGRTMKIIWIVIVIVAVILAVVSFV